MSQLDIIAKYWQGGTDPIRLETLDKICAELKQKGFKRTRDALKTQSVKGTASHGQECFVAESFG